MSEELPKGWANGELADLCELLNGRAYKQEELLKAGKYPVLRVGNFFTNKDWYYSDLELEDNKYCSGGDLLYAWSASFGPRIWMGNKVIYHYHIWKVQLRDGVSKRFLYHLLDWDKERIKSEQGVGSTMVHVTKQAMEQRPVSVPPDQEQNRIAVKIDSLFVRSSRARDELARIPRLIERYRQAVLESAFRGDLTADWRAANPGASAEITTLPLDRAAKKGRRQEKQFTLDLPAIPAAWAWSTFGNCILGYQNGLSKREGASGTPENVLRLADVEDGRIVSDSPRQIILNAIEKADYELRPSDLIFIRVNGSTSLVGRCLLFSENTYWAFCDHFIRARANPKAVDPAFARLFFDTPFTRELIENSFVSSAGQKTISQGTLSALPIPLPPVAEQMLIVKRVEEAFACARRSADQAAAAQNLLTRLDASILDKAFTGKLVPQDPADEPASVLLERIRAARAEAPKPKRGRRAKG